jgi:hypothetical protein
LQGVFDNQSNGMSKHRSSDGRKVKQFIRHISGGALVMLAASIGGSITMLVNNFSAWAILLVLVGGILMTVIVVHNHTKDRIQDLASKFSAEFKSEHMRMKRRGAAKYWLAKQGDGEDLDEVLDFFQDIGYAFKKGEIDGHTVRHDFYTWLQLYWESFYDYILDAHKEVDVWGDIFPLYQITRKIDQMLPLTEEQKQVLWKREEII